MSQTAQAMRTRQMLSADPLPVLLRMASPNALAFLVQASVSMTEVWYVGQLGTVSLAAIALVFPALMLMQMLANGAMGGAVTSAVARALGADRADDAQRLIWHALAIAVTAGISFWLLFLLAGPALLATFGASEGVTREALQYASILFSGCVLIWTMAMLNSVIRGSGNMTLPAMLMVIGAIVQIPLSGTLILGWFGVPSLGITGAAISVLVVSGMSTTILLFKLSSTASPLRLSLSRLQFRRTLFQSILKVGLPSSLSPVFTVLSITMLNLLVSRFGAAALAGYGIGSRVEFLLIPLVFGLGVSMTSMVGINVGAGNYLRAERIGWMGGACAAALTGVVGLLLALYPAVWAELFSEDPATLQSATRYLQIAGPAFAFQGLGLSLYFASQGAGAVMWPVIATFLRFVIGVGVAAVGVVWLEAGLDTIYACTALGMIVYGTVTAAALKFGTWQRR